MSNIFLSYRRDDAAGHAGRLCDRLVARFGADRVFMDVDDIQPGQNFEEAIEQTLARCDVLLVVLGPRWGDILRARAESGEDFVRREIGIALERKMTVIPVLMGGAKMPPGDQLPPALAPFGRCQAVEIRDGRFDEDAARLVGFLAGSAGLPAASVSRWPSPRLIAAAVAALALLLAAWLMWPASTPERSAGSADANASADGVAGRAGSSLPTFSYGTWTLRNARDEEGKDWTNSVLQLTGQEETPDGLSVRGRFTWRLDNLLMGTEEVSGRYVARTRQLILEGSAVTDAPHERPERLAVGSYSAVLDADERTLVKGRWGSTASGEAGFAGEWEAVR